MFDAIATVLAWFYELYHNYAFAIAALTLVIFTLLTPLTLKANRSMMAMQEFQPEMKRIQQQYKDDKQRQQQELMRFYQDKGINPLGGCLPLLIQMPVFLVLFRVIDGLTNHGADGTFDPKYLDRGSELYRDLDGTREMLSFGLNLARSANEVLSDSVIRAMPYVLMVAATGVISWYQQRQVMARQRASGTQMQGPQAAVMKIVPYFLPVFSFFMPAALVVYFIVSGLYRIAQQAYIRWSREREEAAPRPRRVTGAASAPPGGGPAAPGATDGGSVATTNGLASDDGADPAPPRNGTSPGGARPHPKSRRAGKKKRR